MRLDHNSTVKCPLPAEGLVGVFGKGTCIHWNAKFGAVLFVNIHMICMPTYCSDTPTIIKQTHLPGDVWSQCGYASSEGTEGSTKAFLSVKFKKVSMGMWSHVMTNVLAYSAPVTSFDALHVWVGTLVVMFEDSTHISCAFNLQDLTCGLISKVKFINQLLSENTLLCGHCHLAPSLFHNLQSHESRLGPHLS